MEELMRNIELAFAVISGKVSNAINRNMLRAFKNAKIEISPEQWTILVCLWLKVEGDEPSQNALAKATFKDRPSVTRLVHNLEKQGLVKRETNPDDHRANTIILTERGKQMEDIARKVTLKSVESIFKGFSEDDIHAAIDLLGRVFNNLQENNQRPTNTNK